mgnify:CR=1 FL=1
MTAFLQRPVIEAVLFLELLFITSLLLWARVRVFKTTNRRSVTGSYFYDPAVGLHLLVSAWSFFASDYSKIPTKIVALLLYSCSASLFIWAIRTTQDLKFALSETPGNLITSGAFSLSRHPFYTSYILTWLASSLLYSSPILWLTLTYLVAFYIYSARNEESALLAGENGSEYQVYKQQVGMFLPRISPWLKSLSTP